MKRFLFIIISIFSIFIIGSLLMYFYMPSKEPTLSDCIEFGYCKEGTKIFDNGVEVIVNKDYCLKHHYKWDDVNKIGHIHETTD